MSKRNEFMIPQVWQEMSNSKQEEIPFQDLRDSDKGDSDKEGGKGTHFKIYLKILSSSLVEEEEEVDEEADQLRDNKILKLKTLISHSK